MNVYTKLVKFLSVFHFLFAYAFVQATVNPILQPHQTFVDDAGGPCSGCSLYSYIAGSNTPLATYTDASGTTQNTNPVILDAAGGGTIWLSTSYYKFVLKNPLGSTIWTVDQVPGGGGFLAANGCSTSPGGNLTCSGTITSGTLNSTNITANSEIIGSSTTINSSGISTNSISSSGSISGVTGGFSGGISGASVSSGSINSSNCPFISSSRGDGSEVCLSAAPYYASGSATTTIATGTNTPGTSISVGSCSSFQSSDAGIQYGHQGVAISGAGTSGSLYIGIVSTCTGTILTLASATSASVSSASTTATFVAGSNTITVASATGIHLFDTIVSPNVPTPTFVVGISGTTISMSNLVIPTPSGSSVIFAPTIMHDETTAMQSAINYIASSIGRGVIDIVGYNRINGPLQDTSHGNAIILFPSIAYLYTPNIPVATVKIRGSSVPGEGCMNCSIVSTLQPSGNLFGALNYTAGGSEPFTNIGVYWENLVLRSYPNPSIALVNGHNLVQMEAHNVVCDSGDSIGNFTTPINPTNANGYCMWFPGIGNNVTNIANNLWSSGQYMGVRVSEHTTLRDVQGLSNFSLIGLDGGGPSNPIVILDAWCQLCKNTVYAVSQSFVNITYTSEAILSGGTDLYDPSNLIKGSITYFALGHLPVTNGGTNANICTFSDAANYTCSRGNGSLDIFKTLNAGSVVTPFVQGSMPVTISAAGANVSAASSCAGSNYNTNVMSGCFTFTTSGAPAAGAQVSISFAPQTKIPNPTVSNASAVGTPNIATYVPGILGGSVTQWQFAFFSAPPANTTFVVTYNTGQ